MFGKNLNQPARCLQNPALPTIHSTKSVMRPTTASREIGFIIILLTCFIFAGNAQLPLRHFVVFGSNGVQVGTSSSLGSGKVGSRGLVQSIGTASFGGDIHSNGRVVLANSNSVTGQVTAANQEAGSTGPSFQMGSNAFLGGTAHVAGNVSISGGTIHGPVVYSGSYSGPEPLNGKVQGSPNLPLLPQLPSFAGMAHTGGANIINTQTVSPGQWGAIMLNGGKTLTFSAPGVYYFTSIKNSGNFNRFVFNFPNADGRYKIIVRDDVDLYKINISVSGSIPGLATVTNEQLATRVFMHVGGNGSSSANGADAWVITNGASGNNQSTWIGTVLAPNGNINVGSGSSQSKIVGALWSGRRVVIQSGVSITHSIYNDCMPNVNAGTDKHIDCDNPVAVLNGSISGSNPQYSWSRINGTIDGPTTGESLSVNKPGTYVLTGYSLDCLTPATDTVIVTSTPCVLPYYPPPLVGKVDKKIGAELNSLHLNYGNVLDDGKTLFIIRNDRVLIDVIVKQGKYDSVKNLLLTAAYGMVDTITNGPGSMIITGFYPIAKLNKFDQEPMYSLISFVRPSYPPVTNSGLIKTQGDSSMRSNFVRNGFRVAGLGVKVGVLSDSYNTIPNSDVDNGDLPGLNGDSVQVLLEYPYGQRSDEGRAMLQIIHDVAPAARLAFRTGFITAGDMARGIGELADANCNVIVDDVTFITEPFFRPGVIARAIQGVSQRGVHYVTAAGNFGEKSYEGVFVPSPAPLPTGIFGRAHDFGGGDILQSDSVKGSSTQPAVYTLVLQWDNEMYSLGGNPGAAADLDAYAFDNMGNIIGFNRINIEGDPTEVLTFVVTRNTVINLMIVNASSSTVPVRFKYVVFRGEFKINEHVQGFSTIVGQANSPDAITVGAALYRNTPAFGVPNVTLSSFSSVGGTLYQNQVAQKPDIVGPNGVNTSVNFGGPNWDFDGDGKPNFFGTSAAAPHVAGAVALLMEARDRFYGDALSPAQMKTLLKSSAIDMAAPGFDLYTGAGFIQLDSAARTFANPTPQIRGIRLQDSSIALGSQPSNIIISGSYLTGGTRVLMGSDTLESAIVNAGELIATVPAFNGTGNLYLFTAPKSPSGEDGGLSDPYVMNGINKKTVRVIADNKTKKYGENNPVFTATVLVNGEASTLSQNDLGLSNLTFTTLATPSSGVGIYFIRPGKQFDSLGADAAYLQEYHYEFEDGILTVQKMPLVIRPIDQTVTFGSALTNVDYHYMFNRTNVADTSGMLNTIRLFHRSYVPSNALAVIKDFGVLQANGAALTAADLAGMNMMTSFEALNNSRKFEVHDGKLVPATSGAFNNYHIIDVASQSLYNYKVNPGSSPLLAAYPSTKPKAIIGHDALLQGIATTAVNSQLVQLVNGSLVQMVNSNAGSLAPIFNSRLVQLVNGQLVQLVNGEYVAIPNSQLVQLVNSRLVQLVNGVFEPIPNSRLVQLVNGSLVQMVNGQLVQMVNGQLVQLVNSQLVQMVNGQLVQLVNGVYEPIANSRLVQLVNGQLVQMVNGALSAIPNGSLVQMVNSRLVQMVNGQLVQLVNSNGISGTNSRTAVIIDSTDIAPPQNGWLGAMMGVNMITGLDVGQQRLVPGVFVNENFDVTYETGQVTIVPDPCLITHSPFTSFRSTTGQPTSMWLNVEVKMSGQLNAHGDYLLYSGGTITFNNITATPMVNRLPVPAGKIVADAATTAPRTYFDLANHTWVTRVPVGFSSTSDVFISGAIINSSNGFNKQNNANTVLTGVFNSSKNFSGQWSYGMAAYQPQFTYQTIADTGKVVAVNGTYRAGTPLPVLGSLVAGGTGGGGNNYTGSSSSMDNFSACVLAPAAVTTQRGADVPEQELVTTLAPAAEITETAGLTVFPNPARDQVVVRFTPAHTGVTAVVLTDIYGKVVFRINNINAEKGRTWQRSIAVQHLAAGIYYLRVDGQEQSWTRKIVILK